MNNPWVDFQSLYRVGRFGLNIKQQFSPLIALSTLLCVFIVAGCGDSAERAGNTANDRWEFEINNTNFSIPNKYSKGGGRTGDGILETANLWALLPDFEGYDKGMNHHDFYEVYHRGKRIQIMLITRYRRMTVPQYVAKKDAWEENSVLGGRHQGGKYDEMRYGLEYYHSDFNVIPSVYLYREDGIPKIFFGCNKTSQVPYPGCQGLWDYNEEVAVEFDFSVEYLPQWREIVANIKKLLDGDLE
ncbi:hypothetical protein [Microbulbifer rhizosphaerae]|uniref:Uncharacterized protein n=1 Tax=Microbulbifer rhizosphaerae TaxID=1562603 RepID=A0A7W4ZAF7_9GAMM|nr:hypothetical protein [Microbulbifer rhizosphaerae]MBB3061289.1 hypothetical protein [Microbulbifer rhizosphaerae]